MARLSGTQKTFIVAGLACFRTPHEVAADVKETFGVEVSPQAVYHYDPTRPGGPEKWRELFDETRKKFLAQVTDIPIANQAVRLQRLEDAYRRAKAMGRHGNLKMVADLMKQAAEEVGGKYTNHHVLEHAGEVKTTGVMPVPVSSMGDWMAMARAQQEALEKEAEELATAAVGDG